MHKHLDNIPACSSALISERPVLCSRSADHLNTIRANNHAITSSPEFAFKDCCKTFMGCNKLLRISMHFTRLNIHTHDGIIYGFFQISTSQEFCCLHGFANILWSFNNDYATWMRCWTKTIIFRLVSDAAFAFFLHGRMRSIGL